MALILSMLSLSMETKPYYMGDSLVGVEMALENGVEGSRDGVGLVSMTL